MQVHCFKFLIVIAGGKPHPLAMLDVCVIIISKYLSENAMIINDNTKYIICKEVLLGKGF